MINMRATVALCCLVIMCQSVLAQTSKYTYTIKADSVKITNCDSAELVIENHTQGVPGFLFNTGHGRTLFKQAAIRLDDSTYLVGSDTVKLGNSSANDWMQGGNNWGKMGVVGTLDTNILDIIQHDSSRMRIWNTGNISLGAATDFGYKLYVNGPAFFNQGLAALGITTGAGGETCSGPLNLGLSNIVYGNSITFTTNAALTNTNLSPYVFTCQQPTANSGTGYNRLVTLSKIVNEGGAGTANETGLYVNFTVTGTASDLRAVDAAQGNIAVEAGNLVVGGTTGSTSRIDVTGANGYSQFRLRTKYTPTSSSDSSGNVGDFCWDDNYLYQKTSSGWIRTALNTF